MIFPQPGTNCLIGGWVLTWTCSSWERPKIPISVFLCKWSEVQTYIKATSCSRGTKRWESLGPFKERLATSGWRGWWCLLWPCFGNTFSGLDACLSIAFLCCLVCEAFGLCPLWIACFGTPNSILRLQVPLFFRCRTWAFFLFTLSSSDNTGNEPLIKFSFKL